ncbi:hypothetical protein [Treponema sp. R6D11]
MQVLTGRRYLEKRNINKFWREYLLQYFENIVIPKKWRYPETLPLDAQGKKKKEDIELLFSGENKVADNGAVTSEGFGALDKEKIIEKTENSVSIEFSIPATSPYFDGHFHGFPILPAVAQAELVIRFAARHFGTTISPSQIRRVKFTNFIQPDAPLLLKLGKKENSISFNICSPDNKTAYSTGTVILGDK